MRFPVSEDYFRWPPRRRTENRSKAVPAGEDWRKSTRFPPGSYVRATIDGCRRYCQIVDVRTEWISDSRSNVVYDIATIDVVDDEATITRVWGLKTHDLEGVHLNAMQIIALQARSNPPKQG